MTRRVPAIPAAPGRAAGPVWLYVPASPGRAPTQGMASLREAADEAGRALADLADGLRAVGRADEAEILDAQGVIAVDPALLAAAESRQSAGDPPADAIRGAAAGIATRVAASANQRTAARASDILDVADRIARVLEGTTFVGPTRPSIVVARDLPPSAVVELQAGLILGIALEEGSPTAHVAILARALGIPAVVGASGLIDAIPVAGARAAGAPAPGHVLHGIDPAGDATGYAVVDGSEGRVSLGVDEVVVAAGAGAAARAVDAGAGAPPCATADGHRVEVLANLGRPDDVTAALAFGAEGVGLFRTESLFLGRAVPPTEEVQSLAYRRVLAAMGDRPVVVRIADLGGDRAVPYLSGAPEVNPGLGVRGIRIARTDRWLHLAQLRAIARAAVDAGAEPRVLGPMVATIADLDLLHDLCDEAWSQAAPGHGRPAVGAMVEVPAAALMADVLARRADFLSVGTNDLTQYALAADRGVAALAPLQDALNPAVLRLVRATVEGGAAAGVPVAACGVVAGEPDGALVLVGLGVGSLSMEPTSIPRVRAALGVARASELRALAEAALRAPDAATVRGLAAEVLGLSSSRP